MLPVKNIIQADEADNEQSFERFTEERRLISN
jgi:hypothetical protein